MQSANPLKAIWTIRVDASAPTFAFLAIASHHPVIRAELRLYLDRFREMETAAVASYFETHGINAAIAPVAAVTIVQSVAQALVTQSALGTDEGHLETHAAMEAWLGSLAERSEV